MRKATSGRAHASVAAWATSVPADSLYLSAVTLFELELGVLRMERRDAAQAMMLRQWLSGWVLPAFAGRILPVDAPIAIRAACLHVPDPRGHSDAMIASTAWVRRLTVVTRNVADFKALGVEVLNPFGK